VTLRARLAVLITFVLLLAGVGAGVQANADPVTPATPATSNNGCVVVPSLEIAACVARF
jgi:hypothetical protein